MSAIRSLAAEHADVRAALLAQSAAVADPWFAVLDAAADASLVRAAAAEGLRTDSLYRGELGELLDDVAPHLVAFRWNDRFSHAVTRTWRRPKLILLQARAGFDEVQRHLRRFLMVRDERGTKYRFRFYDPRVLRVFLPACTSEELAAFFGPVTRFYAPTRDGRGVVRFARREAAERGAGPALAVGVLKRGAVHACGAVEAVNVSGR